jgi:hypothetical protein
MALVFWTGTAAAGGLPQGEAPCGFGGRVRIVNAGVWACGRTNRRRHPHTEHHPVQVRRRAWWS